jgi:hypothetical protein
MELGAKILKEIVPTIIIVLMENADKGWGDCVYKPVV